MEEITNGNSAPVKFVKKPVRTQKPKRGIKRFCVRLLIAILAILILTSYASDRASRYFETRELKWRPLIQMPVYTVPRGHSVGEAKTILVSEAHAQGPTEIAAEPVVEVQKTSVGSIVAKIYRLESSGGVNDPCVRDRKGFNGYGYQPGTCYKSHAHVTQLVTQWVEKRMDSMPLNQLLCTYNLGPNSKHLTECMNQSASYPYYRDYLRLN